MSKPKRPFNLPKFFSALAGFMALTGVGTGAVLAESTSSGYSKRESGLYRDIFDQNIYYEGTQYLHLERLYRDLFGIPTHSLNVNVFDEVPDSTFFTNRHGRHPMSLEELKRGANETSGPDLSGPWTITKGKFDGITTGFFIRDSKGERYLLKFDAVDSIELATGAEVVAARFLHAIGYQVPHYSLVNFKKDRLTVAPDAKIYDETGFLRKLTPERLEDLFLFIPQMSDGSYRASASKILEGEVLGPMKFQGRRPDDPEDLVNHEDRREIRALQVVSAWLNNFDVRESNSLDVVQERAGRRRIWHYLIDFNSALGATPRGPKPPQFGHEHLFDYEEMTKAFLGLGFRKKPWQKRWDEVDRKVASPSVGYFDNRYFEPERYKTQLPYFPFKDLTRADAFWAAKILMKFSDEEIREMVSTGGFSDPKTGEEIAQVLIERRDLIARYGFARANPLDEFRLVEEGGRYELQFDDLAVHYGFEEAAGTTYRIDAVAPQGKRGRRVAMEETGEPVFKIDPSLLNEYPSLDLLIRTRRAGAKAWGPFVRVQMRQEAGSPRLAGILHQD